MVKKITAAFFISIFIVFNIEATMVSFFIIETGLRHDAGRKQHTIEWENAFLDVFFEAGYIVSNAPIMRLESKPSGEIRDTAAIDINAAREGGADFFIVAQLDYTADSPVPNEICIALFRVSPRERLYEKKMPGRNFTSQRDESRDLRVIAGELVPLIRNR
jgi:hypothetical protein